MIILQGGPKFEVTPLVHWSGKGQLIYHVVSVSSAPDRFNILLVIKVIRGILYEEESVFENVIAYIAKFALGELWNLANWPTENFAAENFGPICLFLYEAVASVHEL